MEWDMDNFSKPMQIIAGINTILGFIFFGVIMFRLIGYAGLLVTAVFIFLSILGIQAALDEHKNNVLKEYRRS